MLVLTRKEEQGIIIGSLDDPVVVRVVRIEGRQVSIAINTPAGSKELGGGLIAISPRDPVNRAENPRRLRFSVTRRTNERILIDFRGVQVRLNVFSIDGDRVKIGIDAPTSITILREELLEQIRRSRENNPSNSDK